MSIHFSTYLLNTYSGTPYFAAHIPADYPLSLVLQKAKAFRNLPPNLQQLSTLSKRWAQKNGATIPGIERHYDDAGRELDPPSGLPLTDNQIAAQWPPDPTIDEFKPEDVPIPDGGFPAPESWVAAPAINPDEPGETGEADRSQILADIESHGRIRTAQEYGVPTEDMALVESDEDLADLIISNKK